jgi:hypothetical protein
MFARIAFNTEETLSPDLRGNSMRRCLIMFPALFISANLFWFIPWAQTQIVQAKPQQSTQKKPSNSDQTVYNRPIVNANSAIVACYDNRNTNACDDLTQIKTKLVSECGRGDNIACRTAKYILEIEQSGSTRRMLDGL